MPIVRMNVVVAIVMTLAASGCALDEAALDEASQEELLSPGEANVFMDDGKAEFTTVVLNGVENTLFVQRMKTEQGEMAVLNGDIILGRYDEVVSGFRSYPSNPYYLWPGATIPYVIDPGFSDAAMTEIHSAIDAVNENTCVRWVPRDGQADYVRFVESGFGCYSYVGRVGGEQVISLDPPCQYYATVLHEMGHAMGAYHEHNRSDRDQYITINWENIEQQYYLNFQKLDVGQEVFYSNYDYRSIMHYSDKAFSMNNQATITTNNPNFQSIIGHVNDASFRDVVGLNAHYGCPTQ